MGKHSILAVSCLLATCFSFGQNKWNRQIMMQSCSISIKADFFTAITFIEMEFLNEENRETEGLFSFELNPGQVVTGFQLELNGKYRDGSIEEKWKATNAYNTIVGKRIDPALLTMEGPNKYTLRIFPFAPRGTRKVTMTIQQLMTPVEQELIYSLPLKVENPIPHFRLDIHSGHIAKPATKKGVIEHFLFSADNTGYSLKWESPQVRLTSPIAFSLPLGKESFVCTEKAGDKNYFALNYIPKLPREYSIHPRKIAVYWDVSASSVKRNLPKEISFLKQYVAYHDIQEMIIYPFNNMIRDSAVFHDPVSNRDWQSFITKLTYSGATKLGSIDMSRVDADVHFVFTDGNNSYGKKARTGMALVYAVHAAPHPRTESLFELIGSGGGALIDLEKMKMSAAVQTASTANYWLIDIRSSSGKVITEQTLPFRLGEANFLNGTINSQSDTLHLHLGNNNRVSRIEKVTISNHECQGNGISRISLLAEFPTIISGFHWEKILDFGLAEKVVTPYTAYIVLERVQDYIKYNISPPADLEEECEKLNYVKKDTRQERKVQQQVNLQAVLNAAVTRFNARLNNWDSQEKPVHLQSNGLGLVTQSKDRTPGNMTAIPGQPSLELDRMHSVSEVVVTAFGMSRSRRDLGYSVQRIDGESLSRYSTVEQALQGKVAGVQITPANHSAISNSYLQNNIRIRGFSSLNSNSQPLFVIDGIPIEGNINNHISVHDIASINVFRGAGAVAIFGSRAINGAILITSRKGKSENYPYYRKYRLKDSEDVDYIKEIRNSSKKEKMSMYTVLSEEYNHNPGFHFDMAQHFFESGLTDEAMDILMNAIEYSGGSLPGLRGAAFVLEKWGKYNEAIEIYEWLLEEFPEMTALNRDLAWAYYRNKNYQEAVNTLLSGIRSEHFFDVDMKAMMLTELNAIISLHGGDLDLSEVPAVLIRPTPVDLRVILDCNYGYLGNVTVNEPGGRICNSRSPKTPNGGTIYYSYFSNNNHTAEYMIRYASKGKYRIDLDYYSGDSQLIPTFVRIMTFRNFGKTGQEISVENVIMDNQYGMVEIGEVKW